MIGETSFEYEQRCEQTSSLVDLQKPQIFIIKGEK